MNENLFVCVCMCVRSSFPELNEVLLKRYATCMMASELDRVCSLDTSARAAVTLSPYWSESELTSLHLEKASPRYLANTVIKGAVWQRGMREICFFCASFPTF